MVIILPICFICGIVYARNKRRLPLTQPNYRYSEQLTQDKEIATNGTKLQYFDHKKNLASYNDHFKKYFNQKQIVKIAAAVEGSQAPWRSS
jgi:hypothetical protein